MTERQRPTTVSGHVRKVREAVRQLYLAGMVDIGGYRNGQPIYRASHRRFRIVTALGRRLHLIACKALGRSTVDQRAEDGSPLADTINTEYALLLRDDNVVMAVKRETMAVAWGDDAAMRILLFGSGHPTEHRFEALCFVLPADQRNVDFGYFTPLGIEIDHIARACSNASRWRDWKAKFEEIVAADTTLTPAQVAQARMFLDI